MFLYYLIWLYLNRFVIIVPLLIILGLICYFVLFPTEAAAMPPEPDQIIDRQPNYDRTSPIEPDWYENRRRLRVRGSEAYIYEPRSSGQVKIYDYRSAEIDSRPIH